MFHFHYLIFKFEERKSLAWWLKTIIPATQKTEIGRIAGQGQPREKKLQ
jgi:hypothetical protein